MSFSFLSDKMAQQQLTAFLNKLSSDESFRDQLQSAPTLEAFLAKAKEAGFDVSELVWVDFVKRHLSDSSEMSDEELSTDELKAVAGGGWFDHFVNAHVILYNSIFG